VAHDPHVIAPESGGYPRPRIPILPVLSFGSCAGRKGELPSVLDAGEALMLTSGRMSIAMAAHLMGVGEGDRILLPAYHCTVMVDPFTWVKASPVFYKVNRDLTPDMDDIRAKLNDRTRAIVVVHYFGFPQDLGDLRSLCDQHDVLLIEDCAHAFFGRFDGVAPGARGDYAIASLCKFFPVLDGGFLISAKHELPAERVKAGGWGFEFKIAINLLEDAMTYGRLRPLNWLLIPPMLLKDLVWSGIKKLRAPRGPRSEGAGAPFGDELFDPSWLDVRMSWSSRAIFRRTDVARLMERRRRNYRHLLERLSGVPGCRPVFSELPDTVVPYMFPLLVDEPERILSTLKSQGMPIFCWEDLAEDVCETSTEYSRHLLQFPCHQELRRHEIEWIATAIREAVTSETDPRS
jgi:dTDP-4-amino-4,6-dideoxygalactose transaminase